MRVPLLLLAALLLFSQCAGDESAVANANAAAGKVESVSGESTAKHAVHGDRLLAIGSVIYATDRITTGADSALEIRLEHNSALWQVRAGTAVVVNQTEAWHASGKSAGLFSKSTQDKTTAAGRHDVQQAGEAPSSLPILAPTSTEAEFDEEVTSSEDLNTETPNPEVVLGEDTPPEPPSFIGGVGTRAGGVDGSGTNGSGVDDSGSDRPRKKIAVPNRAQSVATEGPLDVETVARIVNRSLPLIVSRCLERYTGTVEIAFEFDRKGRPSDNSIRTTGSPKLSKATRICVSKQVSTLSAPRALANTQVSFKVAPNNAR